MKNNKIFSFMMSFLFVLDSPTYCKEDILHKKQNKMEAESKKSAFNNLKAEFSCLKNKNAPYAKKYGKQTGIVTASLATLLVLGKIISKSTKSRKRYRYGNKIFEIPDKFYNDNSPYIPNNSGLYNYTGPKFNNEGHLKWSTYNCWLLSYIYFYFRPEMKRIYEEYSSKSIKNIIEKLDSVNSCESFLYPFGQNKEEWLKKLKSDIQNKDFNDIFYNLFGYPNNDYYRNIDIQEELNYWNKMNENEKILNLIGMYNYITIYRFHYAVSLKNICRIYTKMINNPNRSIDVYGMDDLSSEGKIIPNDFFDGAYPYDRAFGIIGLEFDEFSWYSYSTFSDDFYWIPSNWAGRFPIMIREFNNIDNFLDESNKGKCESEENYSGQRFECSVKEIGGKKYYPVSLQFNTKEWGGHGRISRLKYDENLQVRKIVDKDCYYIEDKITDVPSNVDLASFIENHIQQFQPSIRNKRKNKINYIYYIPENVLRENLEYYKA